MQCTVQTVGQLEFRKPTNYQLCDRRTVHVTCELSERKKSAVCLARWSKHSSQGHESIVDLMRKQVTVDAEDTAAVFALVTLQHHYQSLVHHHNKRHNGRHIPPVVKMLRYDVITPFTRLIHLWNKPHLPSLSSHTESLQLARYSSPILLSIGDWVGLDGSLNIKTERVSRLSTTWDTCTINFTDMIKPSRIDWINSGLIKISFITICVNNNKNRRSTNLYVIWDAGREEYLRPSNCNGLIVSWLLLL